MIFFVYKKNIVFLRKAKDLLLVQEEDPAQEDDFLVHDEDLLVQEECLVHEEDLHA